MDYTNQTENNYTENLPDKYIGINLKMEFTDMKNNLMYYLKVLASPFKENSTTSKVIYFLFLLSLVIGFFYFMVDNYKRSGEIVKEAYVKRDSVIRNAIASNNSPLPQIKTLKQQNEIITYDKEPFLYAANSYSRYSFAFTWMLSITSIITAILGFIILKKGWDNIENDYLKISFFIMFFCSTLSGIVPSAFNYKENAQNNLIKYNDYAGLQIDILDLINDSKGFIKKKKLASLDSSIAVIKKSIKENPKLSIEIDLGKIPAEIKVSGI